MNTTLFVSSFLAGMLTVLAPCVLPLLPIIIGSSISGDQKNKPLRITVSLAISLTLFTLLLKATSLLINIPPSYLSFFSGIVIIGFGIISVFPVLWDKLSYVLGLSSKSDQLLDKASEKKGFLGDVLIGMSLGPVFASCSPTYAVILVTVLPVNFLAGLAYMMMYALGLSTVLLLISVYGRKLINKLKLFANPNGWFKKILGLIFVLVGFSIVTGLDKKVQLFVADTIGFDVANIDRKLIPNNMNQPVNSGMQVELNKNDPSMILNANYKAPELVGINEWINSNPLTLANLKGKVVLIDFWTYSCINCLRTLPYLTKLDEAYKNKGLVIIGVHAPEFAFEKVLSNVQAAVKDNNIQYPVVQDNEFKTWKAFDNQAWPSKFLIDKEGRVRYTHWGEGDYDTTEKAVKLLLGDSTDSHTMVVNSVKADKGSLDSSLSPESYLGYFRSVGFLGAIAKDKLFDYPKIKLSDSPLKQNAWAITGRWAVNHEAIHSQSGGILIKQFTAKKVHLVLGGNAHVKVLLNGNVVNQFKITSNKLYTLLDGVNTNTEYIKDGILEVQFDGEVTANAFTFG
jgi:cytochrome c biogenesis protein CcdA/thiol-disulfide isomerase/thioredoxin